LKLSLHVSKRKIAMTKKQRRADTHRLFEMFTDLMIEIGATAVSGEPGRSPETAGEASPVTATWSIQTRRGEYRCHCYGNLDPKIGIGWIAGRFPGAECPNHKRNFHFDQITPIYAIEGLFKPWLESIRIDPPVGVWVEIPGDDINATLSVSGDYVISHRTDAFNASYRPPHQHHHVGTRTTLEEAKQLAESHAAQRKAGTHAN
jgi:hypothetical protein